MAKERLQLLIEPRQREVLDREARRTGSPIGQLVRDAIDARFDVDRERKRQAIAEMRERRIAMDLSPERIERMIRSEHDL